MNVKFLSRVKFISREEGLCWSFRKQVSSAAVGEIERERERGITLNDLIQTFGGLENTAPLFLATDVGKLSLLDNIINRLSMHSIVENLGRMMMFNIYDIRR